MFEKQIQGVDDSSQHSNKKIVWAFVGISLLILLAIGVTLYQRYVQTTVVQQQNGGSMIAHNSNINDGNRQDINSDANLSNRLIVIPEKGQAHVRSFQTNGEADDPQTNFFAFSENFKGGAFIDTGDFDKDGKDEIITGAGPGGGPQMRLFEKDGTLKDQFFPFHPQFRGGISVAAGDVDGDGKAELGVCQSQDGQAWVKVYRNNKEKTILAHWNAFGSPEVGCNIAMGDIDNDGFDEAIIGAGPGGGPMIRVYDIGTTPIAGPNHGATLKPIQFFAFHPNNRSGINVTVGDVDNDGKAEIGVAWRHPDEGYVKIYRYNNEKTIFGEWRAYPQGLGTGASIKLADIDSDGKAEMITGAGQTGSPYVRLFEADGTPKNINFYAFDQKFRGGIRVTAGNF